ncbi:MAG: preprotein translocase subunit SecE [Cyclonatronaceae bacterium]
MKNPFRSIRIFSGETINELKKATWPTWTELKDSTIVVIIAVIILGIFISIADFSLTGVLYLFTDLVRGSSS